MGGIGGSDNGALDESCLRYKNSVASLRIVLAALPLFQLSKDMNVVKLCPLTQLSPLILLAKE
ncbi:hypothetical protein CCACVL1_19131 [Corchorus capsularis]|uniref:Uncharacterized protein n=1 Tax=Corchorus capsularis TaxID=210143 RepID=A0A1R3HI87_COCAP|nr:hypothetical protein CCACVL1_19131 [Corchorus capsularis]